MTDSHHFSDGSGNKHKKELFFRRSPSCFLSTCVCHTSGCTVDRLELYSVSVSPQQTSRRPLKRPETQSVTRRQAASRTSSSRKGRATVYSRRPHEADEQLRRAEETFRGGCVWFGLLTGADKHVSVTASSVECDEGQSE